MAYVSSLFHVIIIIIIALLSSWLPTLAIASYARTHTDHLALMAIKSSIANDPQQVLQTWKWNTSTSLHFCQWEGVTCGRRHPRVTKLDLESRAIVGTLSPHIGNLSFLRVIRLSNNTFTGVIPPQVGALFRLQKLILINNSFTGEIPATLSNCTRLTVLGLSRNKLTGNLPKQIASLINLTIITLHNNRFTGGIPSFLGNFTFLEAISAANNRLDGIIPSSLGRLQNLNKIGFSNNQLYGIIPPSIYNLSSLSIVDFSENQISGELPSDIGLMLPNLENFQIWGNKFTGSIPVWFSNCSNLVDINLGENGFTGKVGVNFRRMPNLRFLGLFSNSLGSWEADEMKFIDSMINCSKLERLLVHENQLRGVLPDSVGNLSSQLKSLSFCRNLIYGNLPAGIGNLVKLELLDMQINQLTGVIPSEIGNLENLQLLYLHDNNFIGKFPDFIGNLSLLYELSLSINRLEGKIPQNLGNCRSLAWLDLSGNNLTGPIPVELFQLSSLSKALNLAQNHLVGSLPQEIGNLRSLTRLDLSQNDLIGSLPDAIGSCTSLEYLDLKANSFQGPIPPTMKDLRGIKTLDLSSNNFSEQIPRFLEQLNLSSLNLSFNNLDGEVPITGIFKNASAIAIDGNDSLCGGIPELGQPKCPIKETSKKGLTKSRVILIVVPVCSFLVVAMALFLLFRGQRRKRQPEPTGVSIVQPFSRVSYGSILKATDEFSEQNLIGTGSFSVVYKGFLEPVGSMVAIKVLQLENQGALKSFMAECEALKNIRHRNLVKIITSCSSIDFQGNDFKALIYEFMPNGNLERWLHPTPEQEILTPRRLTLGERLTIAIDVANAIHYLHQDCEVPIIHCDLKPSNVLLDSDMVAHIGDFGLAKFLPLKPHQSSSIGIRGTVGYAAPEYGVGSEMTKEGDIYSFGILLLEMMIGKRPTDPIFEEGLNLHCYVMMALPDRLMEIIEPVLLPVHGEELEAASVQRDYSHDDEERNQKLEQGLVSLARIGLACSVESPRERINTSKIIHELSRINGFLANNYISLVADITHRGGGAVG
ncbi:unnamed protein product [Lactuca saligna]|uniref:non-specific serine/threonine protein kinase n=1 Tax=Lactuca saligna TaxID=75948 RepID=A0AA36DW65_LACSI|nr:unnamed protein product [Lactuca saligna]